MNSDSTSSGVLERITRTIADQMDWLSAFARATGFVILFTGCGGSGGQIRVPVAGYVSLDDTPLLTGVIRFVPNGENAGPAASTRIVGGEFRFFADDGPVVASHRVEIEATEFQGFAIDDEATFAAKYAETGISPLANNPIPAIYNSRSTLTATVSESHDQPFTFNLTSEQ